MIRFAILALFFSASVICFAQAPKQKSSKKDIPVFTVNKKPVSSSEFIYLYKKGNQNKAEDFTEQKINEYLDLLINFKLKVEEARARGYDTTTAFKKEFNQYHDELRKPYLPDANVTDSLVRLTYRRMQEEVKASHILINVKPDASPADTAAAYRKIIDIRSKILAGGDFAKAAAEFSEDPSAKSNQGSLGYFTAMQMVYPFENAAYSTPVGQISMPVRTRFGYHILYVSDRKPARGEVEVSHIMLRTGEGKDDAKVKNLIFDINDQLQAGVPWNDLVKQYSEDPGSRENGGKLRPFGVNTMAGVADFERTAFSLNKPGEMSDPFQTQYGWHIMRLERKIPLASFDDMSATLKSRVNRDERTQLTKQAATIKLRKDFKLVEAAAIRTNVLALADTSLAKGQWKPRAYPNAGKETLFSLQQRNYTVQEFLAYAQKNQRAGNGLPAEKYLEQLYNQFIDASILTLQEEKIIHENPEYSYLLHEYYEGILLFEIMEKEVWNKASEDSVGQHAYYSANAAKYQAGERAQAAFYFNASKSFEAGLKPLLEAGDEARIQDFITLHKVKTESGFYKKDDKDKTLLQKVPWTAGIHSIENNGMYYLAWLKQILPAGTMSFEEARPAVISDYQSYLEKNWIAQLKKKYPVKVNGKGKHYILEQLQQK